jgi:uncharacterized protein YjiK
MASITDPINTTFDNFFNRLLIYQPNSQKLIQVDVLEDGVLDPHSLTRFDARHFGLLDPLGMAVDPTNGDLYILDSAVPQILHIKPAIDGSFEGAVISQVDLSQLGSTNLRGIAFNPVTANLHLFNLADGNLYEITTGGQLVGFRELSPMNIANPQAMVFAPSADKTDDPNEYNLFIADSGSSAPEGQSANTLDSSDESLSASSQTQSAGEIAELSFTQIQAPAAASFESILVQTIDASNFNPPSPDTAGIAYIEWKDRFLLSDSEVNEMPIYDGVNLFEITAAGSLENTSTSIGWSNEPTGVAYNPANDHVFISQDDGDAFFELVPGSDGIYSTADDVNLITEVSTAAYSSDPEGLAFDSSQGVLFIVDGIDSEVHRIHPGPNGVFDGLDDTRTNFDTLTHGIDDPEGITYNRDNGNLYIVGRSNTIAIEVTTSGALVQTIDISAANVDKAAGLAYGPGSQNPLVNNLYITERGVDNNSDPNENDGKVYELTLPSVAPAPPIASDDDFSTTIATAITIDVAANDSDPNGNLDPSSANTDCNQTCSYPTEGSLVNNLNGTFTYTPGATFVGDDSFIYEICDTDSLCDTATVNISVGEASIDVRVSASSDDAEERESGNVSLTSSDLELVFDSATTGNQKVGMRFNGTNIPPGAIITSAYVQFEADEVDTGAVSLTIQGEDSDNETSKLPISPRSFRRSSTARVGPKPVLWLS